MEQLPTFPDAKAHAKYLSKTLSIPLTQAQDAVALRYNCNDWSELKTICGQLTDRYISFYGYASAADKLAFHDLLSPYQDELAQYLKPELHSQDSLLYRAAKQQWSRISKNIMSSVAYEMAETPDNSLKNIISLLDFYDDSISRVLTLFEKRHHSKMSINPWLEPWVFGLRFYAYYHFQDNTVTILSREWDLDIHDAYVIPPEDRVFTRPWFPTYMIGYLSYLSKQFIALGYDGSIKICRVNNYRVQDYMKGKSEPHNRTGIYRLYSALLKKGGQPQWSVSKDGHEHDFGIAIPFTSLV